MILLLLLPKERPIQIPELDLVIAISADSSKKEETFALMKNTIKALIDTRTTNKINYSIIIFGTSARTLITFADKSPTTEYLKGLVDLASLESGPPNLKNVIGKTKDIFVGGGLRPNATKTLVIITDKKSSSNPSDLSSLVKQMDDKDVRIITVSIGNEADPNELQSVSTNNNDLIKGKSTDNPKNLAKQIIDRAKIGEIW